MKKKSIIWMFFLAAAVIFSVVWTKEKDGRADQKIKQGVVRFHIRANSDSRKDQAEKLLVRDQVVAYLKPYMEQANTKEDAKRILNSRKKEIAKVAKSTLQKRGKDLPVKVYLTREKFPEKDYGSYVFPEGTYDALRIDLGNASGHNWWCVMYPNMCFEGSVYEVVDGKSEKVLKDTLSETEYQSLMEEKNYKISWKWLDFWDK